MAKVGCVTMILGILGLILAVVCKVRIHEVAGISARSFAAGSGLMLMLSIAAHQCAAVCQKRD